MRYIAAMGSRKIKLTMRASAQAIIMSVCCNGCEADFWQMSSHVAEFAFALLLVPAPRCSDEAGASMSVVFP